MSVLDDMVIIMIFTYIFANVELMCLSWDFDVKGEI